MLMYLSSGRVRWLIVPLSFGAIVLSPPSDGLMALVWMAAAISVGYIEQSVRHGDMAPRLRWPAVLVVTAAALVALVVRLRSIDHDVSFRMMALLGLAGMAGLLTGGFLAGLRSAGNPGLEAAPAEDGSEPKLSVAGLIAAASELTDFRPPVEERAFVTAPEAPPVEVWVEDRWIPAKLVAWDTRDLGLVARVVFTRDDVELSEWLAADRVRPLSGDPAGRPAPGERGLPSD